MLYRLITGGEAGEYLSALPEPGRILAEAILAAPGYSPGQRQQAFEAALAGWEPAVAQAWREAVFAADPAVDLADLLPPPAPQAGLVEIPRLPEAARLDPAISAGFCA